MTKQEFIQRVAERSGLTAQDAGSALDAVLDTVTDALKAGDTITFTGFGKFSTAQRAARTGVNPRTREKMQLAATRVPRFSAGSTLKQAVRR